MKPHRILLVPAFCSWAPVPMHGQQRLKEATPGDWGGGPPAPSAGREQELQQ